MNPAIIMEKRKIWTGARGPETREENRQRVEASEAIQGYTDSLQRVENV